MYDIRLAAYGLTEIQLPFFRYVYNYILNGAYKPRAKLKWIFEIVCITTLCRMWCAIWNKGFDCIESRRQTPLVKYNYVQIIIAAAKRYQAEMKSFHFNIFQQETLQK